MPELSAKDLSLNVPRRIVVVVIKTDLAPSYIARMCHGFETVVLLLVRSRRRENACMSFSISSA